MASFKSRSSQIRQFKPAKALLPKGKHSLQIERLADDGRGVARSKGKTVFVRGGLPGERVEVRYISSRRQFDEAELLKVLEPAEQRIEPLCPVFQDCGGCTLQHLDYSAQLVHKDAQLKYLLRGLAVTEDMQWLPPLSGQAFNYRHRARLAVDVNKRGVRLGFRRDHSHELVDIGCCDIVRLAINHCLEPLRAVLGKLQGRALLREVLLSDGEQGSRLSLLLTTKKALQPVDIERLECWALEHEYQLSLALAASIYQRYWCSDEVPRTYQLPDFSQRISYQITDFTQVNPAVNRLMVKQALDWLALTAEDCVADFFAGVGNFTLPLAKGCQSVKAYELVAAMTDKLAENAELNSVTNIEAKVADLFAESFSLPAGLTKALLDPPRAGALQLCQHLASSDIASLLYISCNPRSLRRDLEILIEGGYRLARASLVDMFPQTAHSEAMLLLVKV